MIAAIVTALSGASRAVAGSIGDISARSRNAVVSTVDSALTRTADAVDRAVETQRTILSGIFPAWHRLVNYVAGLSARTGAAASSAGKTWVGQWSLAVAYHKDPVTAWSSADARSRTTAAALGIRAFAFGIIATAVIGAAAKGAWTSGLLMLVTELLWAAARFIIIALLMPKGTITRARLSVAFLAGLMPYVFGVTAPLRIVSLLLSALMTYRGLAAAGVHTRDVGVAIGWSFGGQAGFVAATWLARAALVLAAGS
jgi:hypothetical protein